jgi:Protein of unknown function (DUF1566)
VSARKKAAAAPAASERYELLGEDVVRDRTTGLTWSRGNVPGGRMNQASAIKACSELELGDLKGWRAPTRMELLGITDDTRYAPAIDPIFHCDCDWYWTITPAAYSPADCAWIVNFDYGDSNWNYQSDEYFVRAVRSSQ